jgi:hypothetical protein
LVSALGGILQLEGYLQVDPVGLDVAVLYADIHVLDPRALYAPKRSGGAGDGNVDELVSDVALNSVTREKLVDGLLVLLVSLTSG